MAFSVLMSVYKSESPSHLQTSLASVWEKQSVKPAQVIIVKDGPLPPQLDDVIVQWQRHLKEVLECVAFPENRGLGAALNVGLEVCKYDLVARMDTDDVASPDRFDKQLEFLNANPEVDILGSFVQEMSYAGDVLGIRTAPVGHDEIVSCLWASPMVHPSVMMRRARVLAAGNYDASLRRRQDYELWFRCAEKGLRFHNLPEPLLYYRFGKHTHEKQTPRLAWEQAMIGYRGAERLGMPGYQRFACFLPFVRSLLPSTLQHLLYKTFSRFDPRRKA